MGRGGKGKGRVNAVAAATAKDAAAAARADPRFVRHLMCTQRLHIKDCCKLVLHQTSVRKSLLPLMISQDIAAYPTDKGSFTYNGTDRMNMQQLREHLTADNCEIVNRLNLSLQFHIFVPIS